MAFVTSWQRILIEIFTVFLYRWDEIIVKIHPFRLHHFYSRKITRELSWILVDELTDCTLNGLCASDVANANKHEKSGKRSRSELWSCSWPHALIAGVSTYVKRLGSRLIAITLRAHKSHDIVRDFRWDRETQGHTPSIQFENAGNTAMTIFEGSRILLPSWILSILVIRKNSSSTVQSSSAI